MDEFKCLAGETIPPGSVDELLKVEVVGAVRPSMHTHFG